jgi:hypothetical protein
LFFQALKEKAGIQLEFEADDVPQYQEWLWDAMSGTFRSGRALQLFAFAGLLRDDMGVVPEVDEAKEDTE